MSTMIMNMSIPSKPGNYLCNLNRKISKPWRVSSTTPAAANGRVKSCTFRCIAKPNNDQITNTTTNFNPRLWDFSYIQSLNSEYKADRYLKKASELGLRVKMLLEEEMDPVRRLELIDNLQKMGISYHFEEKIKQILNSMYHDQRKFRKNHEVQRGDLYSTALEFRLLRQNGFSVSQEVFDCFKNEKGDFKPSLGDDVKGLLQLYEASFLLAEGEETLELAREFSTNFLQKKLDHGIDDHDLSIMVLRALELPLHWRLQRPTARWFIDAYGSRPDANPLVLELAKLDFNVLQATYQEELKHFTRWWKQTCLAEKLPSSRDLPGVFYYWVINHGLFQPEYGYSRIMGAKVNTFITMIDDIYDVHGTLEELEIFNNIIQRWDVEAMDQIPNYMKMCFLAVNNFVNEMAYDVLKEQGFLITPYLRKLWADHSRACLQEAKWNLTGYIPTLEEYISNAWISISGPAILCHGFFLFANPIEKEAAQSLFKYHDIVRYSSMILRLANDLGPNEIELGRDEPTLMKYYMNETGAKREEAEEYGRSLIREMWKKLNNEVCTANSPLPQKFVTSAADLARIALDTYQLGDGHGILNPFDERFSSFLFEPIV